MSDTQIPQLIINELTKAQYDDITPENNQLYLVTDETPLDISDIVTTINSSSTDAKIPSAKAVYNYHDSSKLDKNTDITAGTHTKITYDSKGLVTGGSDLEASDIPNLTLSKITDVTATATELNVLDGITATTTELNYTDGVTSNIQTQLDNKLPNTTKYGKGIDFSGSTLTLKDQDGNALDTTTISVGAGSLSGLTDVTITSPSNNQVLKYDSATSKWVNGIGGSSYSEGNGISIGTDKSINIIQGENVITGISYVGSPTVGTNAEITGITTTDFPYTSTVFNPSTNTWEINVKILTGSDLSTPKAIVGSKENNYDPVAIRIENSKFMIDLSDTVSTEIGSASGTHTVSTNTIYYVKLRFTGSAYILSYSSDGETYTNDIEITSSKTVYTGYPLSFGIECVGSMGSVRYPFNGTIYLKDTSIKIGSTYFWNGETQVTSGAAKATSSLYGLVKPDNSTITISDGVISAVNTGASALTDLSDVSITSATSGQYFTYNGTTWGNTTLSTFSTGSNGLVPGPQSGDTGKFLKGDGTWAEVATTVMTITDYTA